jgi:hypothetical protein
VNGVVDGFETVNIVAVGGTGTDLGGAHKTERRNRTSSEEAIDTVAEGNTDRCHAAVELVIVATSRIANRTTQGGGVVVPRATPDLARKRVAEGVRVQWVGNRYTASGLCNGHKLVADGRRNSGLAVAGVLSPVPVGHAHVAGDVPEAAALRLGEVVDGLLHGQIPTLLVNSKIGPMPGAEQGTTVGAEASVVE